MSRYLCVNSLIVLGVLAASAVRADERAGFYVGAGVGQATLQADDLDAIDFDDSDTAFKVFAGTDFTKHFGAEVAYFDGGAPSEGFAFQGFSGEVEAEISGFNASLVGRIPVSDTFKLFGKLGLAAYKTDVSVRIDDVGGSDDASDNDFSYGVGGAFSFGAFELRAEYEAVELEGDFNMLSLSGAYRF